MASNPTNASIANGDETLLWRTVFEARNSSLYPQSTTPDVDLKVLLSNAASKCIFTFGHCLRM
ncbi:hypothetical protein ES332_A10G236400v1 [Gossypium tomentosum]|uniref:Uncharacterized protein n=1 Tax=Gossypium tomentosum TaxID=34277 RepID=A0A5D2NV07_GOSTO|nr:hypothetical protein ES332_A10G236400v1 [Gossypium tomentosum]